MLRLELIANQSVLDEALEALEAAVPGQRYTLVPTVQGRGGDDFKLGTTVWPEENFALTVYLDEGSLDAVRAALGALKARYPREGIKAFVTPAEALV